MSSVASDASDRVKGEHHRDYAGGPAEHVEDPIAVDQRVELAAALDRALQQLGLAPQPVEVDQNIDLPREPIEGADALRTIGERVRQRPACRSPDPCPWLDRVQVSEEQRHAGAAVVQRANDVGRLGAGRPIRPPHGPVGALQLAAESSAMTCAYSSAVATKLGLWTSVSERLALM